LRIQSPLPLRERARVRGISMKNTTDIARNLRATSTTAEQVLWQQLRARQLNDRKWRRQQAIGPYVVDFFCRELYLIVEVDGDVHDGREERDRVRQEYLESFGHRVIRFTNDDVFRNLDGVLEVLHSATLIVHPSPQPSPTGGEGV
jgi:very-short-patch-repair endonuclease